MRKIVLNAALLLLFAKGFCQNQDSTAKIVFGFNLGLNYSNSQTKNVGPSLHTVNSAGFMAGILMEYKLTKHLSFSPKAGLSFNDSKVIVRENPDDKKIYRVYPVLMEFASHVTYKLNTKNMAPYILFGPSYKLPLTGDKKVQYATMRSVVALDFGIGLDKKLTYFNIAPELRYSLGLTNLSDNDTVGQLYYNTLTLVLNFKG